MRRVKPQICCILDNRRDAADRLVGRWVKGCKKKGAGEAGPIGAQLRLA